MAGEHRRGLEHTAAVDGVPRRRGRRVGQLHGQQLGIVRVQVRVDEGRVAHEGGDDYVAMTAGSVASASRSARAIIGIVPARGAARPSSCDRYAVRLGARVPYALRCDHALRRVAATRCNRPAADLARVRGPTAIGGSHVPHRTA